MAEYPFCLLPEDKHDISNIEKLMSLSDTEIIPLIPDLLKWLQDRNWPVSAEIVKVLSDRDGLAEPYIIELLSPEQKDDVWKYWIISDLLPALNGRPSEKLIASVRRIADSPTETEKMEEVHVKAQEYCNQRIQKRAEFL